MLAAEGIADAGKIELIGDRHLFWPGRRLNELGRVIAEFDLSLRWSRFELDRGDPVVASEILWPFRNSEDLFRRWKGIGEALGDAGHDCERNIAAWVEEAETRRLSQALDDARREEENATVSHAVAEETVGIAEDLKRTLEAAYSFLSPEELPRFSDRHGREAAEKIDASALDACVGKYDYGKGIGVLTVSREGDRLLARLAGQPQFEIFPRSELEFFWKALPASILFVKDETGRVAGAVHTQEGQKLEVRRIE
jgi:hypothetical protein